MRFGARRGRCESRGAPLRFTQSNGWAAGFGWGRDDTTAIRAATQLLHRRRSRARQRAHGLRQRAVWTLAQEQDGRARLTQRRRHSPAHVHHHLVLRLALRCAERRLAVQSGRPSRSEWRQSCARSRHQQCIGTQLRVLLLLLRRWFYDAALQRLAPEGPCADVHGCQADLSCEGHVLYRTQRDFPRIEGCLRNSHRRR